MQTRRDFIEQFIQLRHKRGFTQERLEELSGVSQQQISLIELGQSEPRIDTLLALAASLRAQLVLIPAESIGMFGSTLADTQEELSRQTGVDDLIVPETEASEG
ncbi:MAG: helix-turn-helix domain-containing protein [Chloroflexota bacterium]